MKLTYKLTAMLVAGNCVVLAGHGLLARQREVDMLERGMERDTYLAGTMLLTAVEEPWKLRGQQAAVKLLARASQLHRDMDFRWLTDPQAAGSPLTPDMLADLHAGRPAFERSAGALHTYVPFQPPQGKPGVLQVTKATGDDDAYVRVTSERLLLATLVSVLVSGGLAFLLGTTLVGGPMERLVARVLAVGGGNLSARLRLGRADEIGALAQALDHMADDLQAANRRAETESAERLETLRQLRHAERLATVGRLGAGLAHELGTPLNVVLARAGSIEKDPQGPRVAQHARIIREQSQRMTRIIRQLLDFARRGESRKEPASMEAAARRVLEVLEPLATKRGVRLDLDAASGEAPVLADPGQLEQVLTNLLTNAIHASPEGGQVRVALRREQAAPLPADGGAPRSHWCLSVQDEGPGIPAELRQRIFEPFYTTKDVGEGTGLGLTVAHGIVTDHDGWIEVDSEEGRGTTFRVYLPAREEALAT